MKIVLRFLLALCCAGATCAANETALNEGGFGPEPVGGIKGPESVIRLVSEELKIEFGREFTDVRARFLFRSTKKDAPARQLVGFPDLGAASREAARRGVAPAEESDQAAPLQELRTYVNGEERPSQLQFGCVQFRDGFYSPASKPVKNAALMAWHTHMVSFPPGQDVVLERRYRAPNGVNAMGARFFNYTTATGGAWQGRIDRLTAAVTLRDGLTLDDLAWEGARKLPNTQRDFGPWTSPAWGAWEKLSKTKMQLVWEDFEPRTDQGRRFLAISTVQTAR